MTGLSEFSNLKGRFDWQWENKAHRHISSILIEYNDGWMHHQSNSVWCYESARVLRPNCSCSWAVAHCMNAAGLSKIQWIGRAKLVEGFLNPSRSTIPWEGSLANHSMVNIHDGLGLLRSWGLTVTIRTNYSFFGLGLKVKLPDVPTETFRTSLAIIPLWPD